MYLDVSVYVLRRTDALRVSRAVTRLTVYRPFQYVAVKRRCCHALQKSNAPATVSALRETRHFYFFLENVDSDCQKESLSEKNTES